MTAYVIGSLGLMSKFCLLGNRVKNGYIRDSETYFNMNAKRISEYSNIYYHVNWGFGRGRNHFYVIDECGREVFNFIGLGYH